jgi:Tfp pilus assembly protein PilO
VTLTKEKKKQLIFAIMAGILVLGCAYYFGFRLIDGARDQTDKRAKELKAKVEKMKKTIEDGEAAQKKIEALQEKIKPLEESMPPEQAETWLARATDTIAKRHFLKLKSLRLIDSDPFVLEEFKGCSHYGVAGYAFSVQGTYFKLGEFLADLEGSHPLMVVESISISSGAGGALHVHEMAVKISMVTQKS